MNRHRMTGLFLLAAGLCAAYEAKAPENLRGNGAAHRERAGDDRHHGIGTRPTGGHLHRQGGG